MIGWMFMKIVAINSLPNGSPATIMRGVLKLAEVEKNAQTFSFYGAWKNTPTKYKGSLRFGYKIENYCSALLSYICGLSNIFSIFGTISLINKIKKIKPDIIHLHNLHLQCINLPILFSYIKKNNIRVIWTLHDCWSFTGRCPHFQLTKCYRWRTGCYSCPYSKNSYPITFFDNSRYMWKLKKKWFSGLNDLTIVTPSEWLADLVKQSFLKDYSILVINNGIDIGTFRPTDSKYRNEFTNFTEYINK